MRCSELKAMLETSLPSLLDCKEVEGYIRVAVPFQYPDGDRIYLFVRASDAQFLITDMGETLRYLSSWDFRLKGGKRAELFRHVVEALGVTSRRGALYVVVDRQEEIAEGISRLAQAVIRVSDLLYTARSRTPAAFKDEVRDLLDRGHFHYEEDCPIVGKTGKTYEVDFGVRKGHSTVYVKLVSASASTQVKPIIDKIIRMWYDVSLVMPETDSRISLFDDLSIAWPKEDRELVGSLSAVYIWSQQREFLRALRAA